MLEKVATREKNKMGGDTMTGVVERKIEELRTERNEIKDK